MPSHINHPTNDEIVAKYEAYERTIRDDGWWDGYRLGVADETARRHEAMSPDDDGIYLNCKISETEGYQRGLSEGRVQGSFIGIILAILVTIVIISYW